MRWSSLKKLLQDLLDPALDIEIHCTAYRGEDGNNIGRYWINLDGDMVWEVPKQISKQLRAGTGNTVASKITQILRDYLDTPKDQILIREFPSDIWGITDILKASDRRVGKRRLFSTSFKDPVAEIIREKRLS